MYFVYILRCADQTLYAGCTSNLERRLKEHNGSKRGARYTKARRPVTLVYSKAYATIAAGRRREAEIKRMSREQKLIFLK